MWFQECDERRGDLPVPSFQAIPLAAEPFKFAPEPAAAETVTQFKDHEITKQPY
jgi:hypothetical protein